MRLRIAAVLFALSAGVSIAAHAQNPDHASICRGWQAWRTHPQSGSPVLHVTADCKLPTPAHKLELVPATPQGADASVFVLNEVVHPPEGMIAQVITPYKLHYRKRGQAKYKEVLIEPSDTHVLVEDAAKKAPEGSGEAQ
jgi:hypothetical protein